MQGCQNVFRICRTTADRGPTGAPPGRATHCACCTVSTARALPSPTSSSMPTRPTGVGLYPAGATRHGRLRGWALTDAIGRYGFFNRPAGAYPDRNSPAHPHHIIEPGRCTYYLGDIQFSDDPRLTATNRAQDGGSRGGPGLVNPSEPRLAVSKARHYAGLNVPGYRNCSR